MAWSLWKGAHERTWALLVDHLADIKKLAYALVQRRRLDQRDIEEALAGGTMLGGVLVDALPPPDEAPTAP